MCGSRRWRGVISGGLWGGMRYRLALYLDEASGEATGGLRWWRVFGGGLYVLVVEMGRVWRFWGGFRRRGLTRMGLLRTSRRLGRFLGSSWAGWGVTRPTSWRISTLCGLGRCRRWAGSRRGSRGTTGGPTTCYRKYLKSRAIIHCI